MAINTDTAPSTPAATWRANGEPDPHGKQYDCERAALTLGNLSDDELANGAFMNYDQRLSMEDMLNPKPGKHMPIVWMTAVKERIRWLSRALVKAQAAAPAVAQGDERAAFEKWITDADIGDLAFGRDGECYVDWDTQVAWRGWKGARAASPAAPAQSGDALTRELLETLQITVKHFTKTPSTLADSQTRGKAHEVIAKAYELIGYGDPTTAAQPAQTSRALTTEQIDKIRDSFSGVEKVPSRSTVQRVAMAVLAIAAAQSAGGGDHE